MHLEKGFTLKESNYIDFMARIRQVAETLNWELFSKKRPGVDEELVREFYANLTSSELTEVPVRGIKVPITSNAINEFFELPDFKNDEYSSVMSNIKPKNLQEIAEELTVPVGEFVLQQQVEESEDPEEDDEDPTMQSAEVPDKEEPMEPEVELDIETSMFRAQSPHPDLRNELSKLMDIMQHMQWQQLAY
ncbi:hypothetical protein PVK06_048265 [Gossypium arboreum]|uniref:Putative plant transposon protein domain-containing protein n=1 Tax=Gossypium arboreum TaxID=29729 RepID=A0ABR0MFI0_GOSAR|nr:hypothetical protein PVK06_048265 [Gossypium arboreum]